MAKKRRRPARQPNARRPQPARSEAPAPRRPGRRRLYAAVVAVAVAAVGIAVFAAAQSDSGDDAAATATTTPSSDTGSLLRTKAPWSPQSDKLRERVEAAGFPPVGDESYHVHALLSVFVDGKQVPVPTNIGIDQASGFHSPLHTHTPDGVIHFEADDPSAFTLQQVFEMWGVDFSADRLGAYTPEAGKQIYVYVNGEPVIDSAGYEIENGDNVVVAYGADGSFPTEPPADALENT